MVLHGLRGLACAPIVETRFLELAMFLFDFSPWIPLGTFSILFKAILRLYIYKALYDKSYLGSTTTMTTGEWSCLSSFAWAPQSCLERRGSEKFEVKIYVSNGIRTYATPLHDKQTSTLDIKWSIYRLAVSWFMTTKGHVTIHVWNRLWFDSRCSVL